MPGLSPSTLGIVLLVLGLGVFALTLFLTRAVPRGRSDTQKVPLPPMPLEIARHNEAIFLVQRGGRVVHCNPAALQLLNLDEELNLNQLGRRARPSEVFWGLCAAEGQARFLLDGRVIEGISYAVPYGSGQAILVTLRHPRLLATHGDEQVPDNTPGQDVQGLNILAEVSQAMTSSLELEATLRSIVESVEYLVPCDRCEITIWDADSRYLIPHRLTGTALTQRKLEVSDLRIPPNQGYTGYLVIHRQPLLISDVDHFSLARPIGDKADFPFRSFLGLPLEAGGELVGTLELASLEKASFTEGDLELLRMLSRQAALALHNALSYEAQEKRARELVGLARLAQAITAEQDPKDLFSRLVESIAPLLEANILGFWVMDESQRTLVGQVPFLGIQDSVVEWTRVTLQPGSQAEKLWLSQESLVSGDASSDDRIKALGLEHFVVAAGVRQTALVPLTSSGHMLGYLQVANKQDGSDFDQADLRLLAIIAGQAAPIIENAGLVHESRRRAQRAEMLRRIANLTASSTGLDDILKLSLQELAQLLGADMAFMLLFDESKGELRLHRPSLYGISPEITMRLGRLPVDDPEFPVTATGSAKPLLVGDVTDEPDLISTYRNTAINLHGRSLLATPLVLRKRGIGEIVLIGRGVSSFNSADLQVVTAAADQLAGAIERADLYAQTDESLRRRVEQLTAVTRVSRELSSTLQLEQLLQRVFEEVLRTTRADCGTILLFALQEEDFQNDITASPRELLRLGDPSIAGLHSLERMVLKSGETLIVNDFNPLQGVVDALQAGIELAQPAHEGIQSAMIIPILYQDRVAGLIHLHARAPFRFDDSAREIGETLAIQAAIAIGNAQRYQEQYRKSELLNRRMGTLAKLLETSQTLQLELPLDQALEEIAYAIQAATPFDIVVISVYDPDDQRLHRMTNAGLSLADMDELRAHPQSWGNLQNVLKPEFRIGRSYFIPFEQMPVMPPDVHSLIVQPVDEALVDHAERPDRVWHPEDALVVPLLTAQGEPLGLISVDAPRDHLRPDLPTIETLEIFGSHAGLVIESQRKLSRLQGQLDSIQHNLQVSKEAAENLPGLLQKEIEQSLALRRLDEHTQRIRAGVDIADLANSQSDRLGVLRTLGSEILSRFNSDIVLVVEPGSGGPHLLEALGSLPSEINLNALLGQRNPLHHCLRAQEQLLVDRLEEDRKWAHAPLLQALDAQAFICFPVLVGDRVDAAVLGVSRSPLEAFTEDDQHVFTLLSRQVGVTIQNLGLITETSQRLAEVNLLLDFNRHLGGLNQSGIAQALAQSILQLVANSQAVMVALWDTQRRMLVPEAALGYADAARLVEITYHSGEALPGTVFESGKAVILDEVDFAQHYSLSSENLLRYRNATGGKLPASSMAVPIQPGEGARALGVVVVDNFQLSAAFTPEMCALVASLAQQAALNLENTRLVLAAEERASQLEALTGAAATLTSSLHPDNLIAMLLALLEAILPYDTGTLWLKQGKNQMVVRAARGFSDDEQRLGLTAALEDSALLNEMDASGQPIAVSDVRADVRFPALIEPQHLSWLGVPLITSGEVTGVIALEKTEANYYTQEHCQIAATFASQAAVALENARLYHESLSRALELDQRSQRLEMLNRLSASLIATLEPQHILLVATQELGRAIQCSGVSALLFDAVGVAILQAESPPVEESLPYPLPAAPLFERLRQTQGVFNTENISAESELAPLSDFLEARQARSLMALALAAGNETQGVLLAYADRASRFSPDEVELARTIANQVSIAIQNARLYAETRRLSQDLEQRVIERTAQLEKAHQRAETLLRINMELSTSLDVEQVLNQSLHLVNQIVHAGQLSVLIARSGEKNFYRLASMGYAGSPIVHGQTTPINTDEGLAGWVINARQTVLIDDLLLDPRWLKQADAPEPHHRSALAVPLMMGAECLGVLLLYHQDVGHFSSDHLDLIQAVANQMAVAVNNAELYRLIRDQAEDLGQMFRRQQVEASRSRAILEAVADGVLVTDANRNITLFNASAEEILGLGRSQVIGKSLDHFTGLFGRAAQRWIETVQTWTRDPNTYELGELYAEQIKLEGGRVVSVHLSPVIMGDSFLGTVSTFRDVTHQVQLDRLKTEFVATVSHELRTTMTSIKGYVDILLMGAAGALNEQQVEFLDIVRDNTQRLTVLVNDLLDISRIESGRVTLSMLPLHLGEIVAEGVTALRRRAESDRKPMEFRFAPPSDLPPALGDPERVRLILDNLLENAYYYTAPNGRITVHLHANGGEIQVDVQDTGIGIPEEAQARVFERFFRGEHPFVLSTSGTGLGLSIVQHLVEMHNGRIWVESSGIPGEGSTFSFTLPVFQINETSSQPINDRQLNKLAND